MRTLARMAVIACLLGVAATAAADTLTVRQDGSGDFLTIGAAVAAAVAGDLIDVGAGTYYEQVVVAKSISLSGAGASSTVIDGSLGMRPLKFEGAITASAQGLTLAHGTPSENSGGGLRVQGGASVTAQDCTFLDNTAIYDGGGFFVWQSSRLDLIDCEFTGNFAGNNGAAGELIQSAQVSATGCRVRDNNCGLHSGGFGADHATLQVSDCLFAGNTTVAGAGALYYYLSSGSVSGSTFYANSSPDTYGGSVVLQSSSGVLVERCIFAQDVTGRGLAYLDGVGARSCNLFWDNQDGPLLGDALHADDFLADPFFCNPADGEFSIASNSTAAPAHNSCGVLIGAFPVACGPVGVEESSWSAVKARY